MKDVGDNISKATTEHKQNLNENLSKETDVNTKVKLQQLR